jgi:hypothetical protein
MTSIYQFSDFATGIKWANDVIYGTKDLAYAEQNYVP